MTFDIDFSSNYFDRFIIDESNKTDISSIDKIPILVFIVHP